jgi:hypothetical protein
MPYKVVLSDWIWRRKWWVMYLIVIDRLQIDENVLTTVGRNFEELTYKYVRAYMEDGKMPPEEIAPAILNMADDYMAGRQVAIRAGDYIALQNFIRKEAKSS